MKFRKEHIISGSCCIDKFPSVADYDDAVNTLPAGQMNPGWTINDECLHEWVEYHGLMESFFYCKHCDKKRPYGN